MIYGNDCAGTLASFAGDDQLSGVGGNDRLYGGAGDDTLTGGAGADVFAFAQGSGDDTIIDFDVTTDWLGQKQTKSRAFRRDLRTPS